MAPDYTQLRIGFAAEWLKDRSRTWSGTPYSLLVAMQRTLSVPVYDIDLSLSSYRLLVHKILTSHRYQGKIVSNYRFAPLHLQSIEKKLRAKVHEAAEKLDAILMIGDVGTVDNRCPFYLYQDMNTDYVLENYGKFPPGEIMFSIYSYDEIVRRKTWQDRVYSQCAGIFVMSRWMADYIIHHSGVDSSKVHVVHAGNNMALSSHALHNKSAKEQGREKTILFIGRDFLRKGGDLVLAAFRELRKSYGHPIRLIVIGPATWPVDGDIPDGVEFIGDIPYEEVRRYYFRADVFCMPSRYEGFGLVFAEALSHGVPCIGRNAFAMPEIIASGDNGYLVDNDDPTGLAGLLARVLDDDVMQQRVRMDADRYREYYSWDRVARDMLHIISRNTQL